MRDHQITETDDGFKLEFWLGHTRNWVVKVTAPDGLRIVGTSRPDRAGAEATAETLLADMRRPVAWRGEIWS